MKPIRGALTLLCTVLFGGAAQAEVTIEVPAQFHILAVSKGTRLSEQRAMMADGEQQLLVRFVGTIPSRSSSENDRQINSEPQVLRYQAQGQTLTLVADVPADERGMTQYARSPTLRLQNGPNPLPVTQDVLRVNGLQLGIDWQAKLDEYNRDGGKASLATQIQPTTVTAAPIASNSPLEAQLQQLFLQADPALRKRFVSWAVPQL
ncbi:DUF2057 domain-containing protein [Aeromonas cavernicola]|uniref:DUF2057 domain-containing protein n=1 Tax=Aeromonas cavernicola TaxID=1006623 RepID=A0A2H9U5H4_9GAMM|nr:DUF2057 domain-containing protein [Aeromonas cavernicola]PJG59303.1 DUF2057 domain-containing protein [Aeromonas cavernicola]